MNRKRIREDILANLDKLPENFTGGVYYNLETSCYCFYGWLCAATGGPDPKNYEIGAWMPVATYLRERYDLGLNIEHLYEVDRIVRTIGRHNYSTHLNVAPAREVAAIYLNEPLPEEATPRG